MFFLPLKNALKHAILNDLWGRDLFFFPNFFKMTISFLILELNMIWIFLHEIYANRT